MSDVGIAFILGFVYCFVYVGILFAFYVYSKEVREQ